nr:uncharacterized protein LOC109738431 [Aegilops tauschii subsp. strangulata]
MEAAVLHSKAERETNFNFARRSSAFEKPEKSISLSTDSSSRLRRCRARLPAMHSRQVECRWQQTFNGTLVGALLAGPRLPRWTSLLPAQRYYSTHAWPNFLIGVRRCVVPADLFFGAASTC